MCKNKLLENKWAVSAARIIERWADFSGSWSGWSVCDRAGARSDFNLGYLPSADKSIITLPNTTLQALSKLLTLLMVGGRIAIMVYYGHDGGSLEKDALLDFVKQLDQRKVSAMLYQPLNQVNTPPFLIMLEKLADF